VDEFSLIDLLGTIGSTKIKRCNGNNLQCTCPFAEWTHPKGVDANPSFSVSLQDPHMWNCFSCGNKGRALKSLVSRFEEKSGRTLGISEDSFVVKKERYDPASKTKWNGGWYSTSEGEKFEWKNYEPWTTGEMCPYAVKRNITEEQYRRWKLGWNRQGNGLFIPLFDELGWFVGYSMRACPPLSEGTPKYKHAKGFVKQQYLYGEWLRNPQNRTAFLVEGFADAWRLDRMGLENCFAVMGTQPHDSQIMKIYKWFDTVVYFQDFDNPNPMTGLRPGEEAAKRWRDALLKIGKKIILSPVLQGRKDVDEWLDRELMYVLRFLADKHSIEIRRGPCNDDRHRSVQSFCSEQTIKSF
jgi:DNA primase